MSTLKSRKIIITVTLAAGETREIKVSKKIPDKTTLLGERIVVVTSCCDIDSKTFKYNILDKQ
jgi:sporulation-control protein spo0M